MSRAAIIKSFEEAKQVLVNFLSDSNNIDQIENAGNIMVKCILSENKIFACGNGGSMSDAMHFAEELTGRFRGHRQSFPAIAISDPTHMSCTANDYGFDHVFSRYIEGLGKKGDVLLAISTSGNSRNVIEAAIKAKQIGMKVVSLTGKTGGKLKELSDVNIHVNHQGYSDRVQEIHIKAIHILIEYIELKVSEGK